MIIDRLIEKIIKLKCPICVGLDTSFDYIPKKVIAKGNRKPLEYVANSIYNFNSAIIDEIADIVPSVKIQAAYYEMYGIPGIEAMKKTIDYAKEAGLIVILDVKRNDIGATAMAYSSAYIGKTEIEGVMHSVFDADFLTVNGYLGTDGIKPFTDDCKQYDKGIFVLVKTSNKSSFELQDLECNNKKIYDYMADLVDNWGEGLIGKYGYSSVGAVIGATYPTQAEELRKNHKNIFVLIPGYGAQGGSAQGLLPNFDSKGLGGIVNNSRAILTAWQRDEYSKLSFEKAAKQATIAMREDILTTFSKNNISY